MPDKILLEKYRNIQQRQVEWYALHGKYPDRVRHDNNGKPFVVGDVSWERWRTGRPEIIEPEMDEALGLEPSKSTLKRTNAERNAAIYALREQGKTLAAIGDEYKLTRERVRQICHIVKKRATGIAL